MSEQVVHFISTEYPDLACGRGAWLLSAIDPNLVTCKHCLKILRKLEV